jgi:hypothetical protein
MRITAGVVLAAIAFALPSSAQTESQPPKATGAVEKLWKIEAAGISG